MLVNNNKHPQNTEKVPGDIAYTYLHAALPGNLKGMPKAVINPLAQPMV